MLSVANMLNQDQQPVLLSNLTNDKPKETPRRRPSILDINNLLCSDEREISPPPILSPPSPSSTSSSCSELDAWHAGSFQAEDNSKKRKRTANTDKKVKRRRATSYQLQVLNKVFEQTFFPSTQLRADLGQQLGMSPRTVQIWFQNRRQAMRMRERRKKD